MADQTFGHSKYIRKEESIMKKGKLFTAILLTTVMLAGCIKSTPAANESSNAEPKTDSSEETKSTSEELKKLVIAEPLHSIGYLPLYVAQEGGFFKEEGLDVEFIQATGGTHVTSVIIGEAWGVIGGIDSNAIANAKGDCPEPITSFCNCVNKANVYLCASVDDPYTGSTDEDLKEYLKGKTINTGRFGGSPNLLVRYLLLQLGLDPDTDVTLIEPSDVSTSVAMVQTGQANISWATEPQIMDGIDQGVWGEPFYKFPDLGDFSYSVISTRTSTIEKDPETVQKFTNAILRALDKVTADRDFAVEAAAKEFPTTDKKGIEAAINRAISDNLWSKDGMISQEAVNNDMNMAIASKIFQGDFSYDTLVNMNFIEKASK